MRFTSRSVVRSLAIVVVGLAASSSLLSQSANPTVAHYAGPREDAPIPRPGMTPQKGRVAVVVTDPQNDFLSPKGVAWGVVGQSVQENHTVENIEALFKTAKAADIPVFVSPHYYYPQDHHWKFGGALEVLMHNIGMFDRKGTQDRGLQRVGRRLARSLQAVYRGRQDHRHQPSQGLRPRVQ